MKISRSEAETTRSEGFLSLSPAIIISMKVSVLIVTYNHEQYIAQALDSALMQETSFDYEIVVGEDNSTDSTRDIVAGFQERFPDKVRLLPSAERLGMQRNYMRTWKACVGEYIAMLDGDDYWTSAHKLQKQVDFLDSHPECAMCFHQGEIRHPEGESIVVPNRRLKSVFATKDMFFRNDIPNCSVMYRHGLLDELPDGYQDLSTLDWPMHMLIAQHGKMGYIDELMAVWRYHRKGEYSGRTRIERLLGSLGLYRYVAEHISPEYRKMMRAGIARRYFLLMQEYDKHGDFENAKRFERESLKLYPLNVELFAYKLKIVAIRSVPSLVESLRFLKKLSRKALRSVRKGRE